MARKYMSLDQVEHFRDTKVFSNKFRETIDAAIPMLQSQDIESRELGYRLIITDPEYKKCGSSTLYLDRHKIYSLSETMASIKDYIEVSPLGKYNIEILKDFSKKNAKLVRILYVELPVNNK